MDILLRLNWIDGAVLLIALISVVLAVRRGGIFEIILLSGLLAAFLGGYLICEWAVYLLRDTGIAVWMIKIVTFPLSFLLIYMMFSSIAQGMDMALHAVKFDSAWLDIGDGLFGIALGLLRGFLFICLLYLGIMSLYNSDISGSDVPDSVKKAYVFPMFERAISAGEGFYNRPDGIMHGLRIWVGRMRPYGAEVQEEIPNETIPDETIPDENIPDENINEEITLFYGRYDEAGKIIGGSLWAG